MQRKRTGRIPVPWRERFFRYVHGLPADTCWEWQGARDHHGYGRLQRGGRGEGILKAHRASWEIHNGPIPAGMDVLHKCDNPPCCHPGHLFLGTAADNAADKMSKGRGGYTTGDARPSTRIPDAQVRAVRLAARDGMSYPAIAERHGLTAKYVCALVLGHRRAAAGGPIKEAER